MFEALSVEEQKRWGEQAKEEHEAILEVWKETTTGELSRELTDRQQ